MYIGIDLGTSSIKAILINNEQEIIENQSINITTQRPYDGWAEQSPQAWWQAVDELLLIFKDNHPQAMVQLRAIGLSGQMHGLIALDDNDNILRPAILWCDARSQAQSDFLNEQYPFFQTINGNMVMSGFTAPKILWMQEYEPELFKKIKLILLPKDYMRYLLSGMALSDMSDAAGTSWLDVASRDWSDELLAICGLNRSHMPALSEGCETKAFLKPALAQRWGIKQQVVIAGAGDNAAAACGLGAVAPKDSFISLGTSGVVFTVTDSFKPFPENGLHTFCHALPNRWHAMGVILSATDSLTWWSEITSKTVGELTAEVTENDILSCPILFHPYLSGERTPHNDTSLKASIIGINRNHNRAQITASILLGVAFAIKDCVDVIHKTGVIPNSYMATGGGAKNKIWLQAISDIINNEIHQTNIGDYSAALGATRLGMMAREQEERSDVLAQQNIMREQEVMLKPNITQIFTPNQQNSRIYQNKLQRWRTLHQEFVRK